MKNYYVYVYIDPRNFDEFYYGKGKRNRKEAHLLDKKDTAKTKRIKAIQKEGLEPIIKIIARNLTETEAFLVEKTLLWQIGKWTDNISGGKFKNKFRPPNTFHKDISGFDFENVIYFYNVGEGGTRNWDDYIKYNIISAGQNKKYKDVMEGFSVGDIFLAYIKGKGFVGIGRISSKAKMVRDIQVNGKPLLSQPLKAKEMNKNCDNPLKSEYVCRVKWIKRITREKAVKIPRKSIFIPRPVRAKLDKHQETIRYFERHFDIKIRDVLLEKTA
jgi:uncharacterized protein